MGPIVDETMQTLVLRPFQTSTTYRNLKQTGCGVFHVTDDVLLLAQAAIGALDVSPETFPAAEFLEGDPDKPLVLGLVGSLIGGIIAQFFGTGSIWELNVIGFVLAVVAAVLLVGTAEAVTGRSESA